MDQVRHERTFLPCRRCGVYFLLKTALGVDEPGARVTHSPSKYCWPAGQVDALTHLPSRIVWPIGQARLISHCPFLLSKPGGQAASAALAPSARKTIVALKYLIIALQPGNNSEANHPLAEDAG